MITKSNIGFKYLQQPKDTENSTDFGLGRRSGLYKPEGLSSLGHPNENIESQSHQRLSKTQQKMW